METITKSKTTHTIIGVFDSHLGAIEAIKDLEKNDFPIENLAFIGRGEAVKEIEGVHTWSDFTEKGAEVGGIFGGVLGILAGLSLITIPGLGVLYIGGAWGAVFGGLSGVGLGSFGGSLIGALGGSTVGAEGSIEGKEAPEELKVYRELLEKGQYLVVVQDAEVAAEKARKILDKFKPAQVRSHDLIW